MLEYTRFAGVNVEIQYVDAEQLNDNNLNILDKADGIIVPGGFGERGIEGKNKCNKIFKRKKYSVFRNLFRDAGCCNRVF